MSDALDAKAGWSSWCRGGDPATCASLDARCANPSHARRPLRLAPEPTAEPIPAAPADECESCGGTRTETDAVADAVAALLRADVSDAGPHTFARLTGLDMSAVRAALERWDRGGYEPPTVRRATRRRPRSKYNPGGRAAWNKLPEGETRVCKKCDLELPIACFRPRTDSKSRRSWCDDCVAGYQSERYLSVDKLKAGRNILRLILRPEDDCVGDACPGCGWGLEVGQEVELVDVVFHHVGCRETP